MDLFHVPAQHEPLEVWGQSVWNSSLCSPLGGPMLVSEYVREVLDSTELRLTSGMGASGRSRTKPARVKGQQF